MLLTSIYRIIWNQDEISHLRFNVILKEQTPDRPIHTMTNHDHCCSIDIFAKCQYSVGEQWRSWPNRTETHTLIRTPPQGHFKYAPYMFSWINKINNQNILIKRKIMCNAMWVQSVFAGFSVSNKDVTDTSDGQCRPWSNEAFYKIKSRYYRDFNCLREVFPQLILHCHINWLKINCLIKLKKKNLLKRKFSYLTSMEAEGEGWEPFPSGTFIVAFLGFFCFC